MNANMNSSRLPYSGSQIFNSWQFLLWAANTVEAGPVSLSRLLLDVVRNGYINDYSLSLGRQELGKLNDKSKRCFHFSSSYICLDCLDSACYFHITFSQLLIITS